MPYVPHDPPRVNTGFAWIDALANAMGADPMGGLSPQPMAGALFGRSGRHFLQEYADHIANISGGSIPKAPRKQLAFPPKTTVANPYTGDPSDVSTYLAQYPWSQYNDTGFPYLSSRTLDSALDAYRQRLYGQVMANRIQNQGKLSHTAQVDLLKALRHLIEPKPHRY